MTALTLFLAAPPRAREDHGRFRCSDICGCVGRCRGRLPGPAHHQRQAALQLLLPICVTRWPPHSEYPSRGLPFGSSGHLGPKLRRTGTSLPLLLGVSLKAALCPAHCLLPLRSFALRGIGSDGPAHTGQRRSHLWERGGSKPDAAVRGTPPRCIIPGLVGAD